MNAPLEAVSNVIELKPDKKYLLVFKDGEDCELNREGVLAFLKMLEARGIQGIGITLLKGQELQVIEVPSNTEEQAQ